VLDVNPLIAHNTYMNTQAHTPRTVAEFVAACKTLDNFDIYVLFEEEITQDLRNELYSYSRPYAETVAQNLAGTHTFEPCRDAMITLGLKHNVQSLIDY